MDQVYLKALQLHWLGNVVDLLENWAFSTLALWTNNPLVVDKVPLDHQSRVSMSGHGIVAASLLVSVYRFSFTIS
jgi:hypothetical protein